uniref:Peptidase C1A papain C-terminal domain-containing protein n=1 Tax=Oryza meridionalis TaxID=40149 RepID=A0A0E0E6T5_9ORYZ
MALRSFGSLLLSKFLPRRICNQAVGPALDVTSLECSSGKQYMLSNVLNGNQRKKTPGSFNRTFHSCPMIGSKDPLPDRVDWTESGGVTSVKNQGLCDTCWIFGPVASVEFLHYKKTGILESLSVQQIIDCNPYGRLCKGGGFVEETLTYIKDHGLTTWSNYPYVGLDGTCKYNIQQKVATISGYYYPECGEEGLQRAVALQPVPVSVFCKSEVFQARRRPLGEGSPREGRATERCGQRPPATSFLQSDLIELLVRSTHSNVLEGKEALKEGVPLNLAVEDISRKGVETSRRWPRGRLADERA